MGVKVAATCMYWSQHVASQSPSSSSHTLASTVSSTSSKRHNGIRRPPLICRMVHRSNLFGTTSTKLSRAQSCEVPKTVNRTLRRATSAGSSDGFSDEEFAKEIEELALRFHLLNDKENDDDNGNIKNNAATDEEEPEISGSYKSFSDDISKLSSRSFNHLQSSRPFPPLNIESMERPWLGIGMDPPDWPGIRDIIPASIERKASSVDIPLSLRILKRKNQWDEGFREAGESAYSSMKKAFSSMVFIIRELHCYTLHMREYLFYEDLQGILARVQREMHASFVWLFQQIFSHTPTLMVYVMILLANFTVHSMAQNAAIASPQPTVAITEMVSVKENQIQDQNQPQADFDISSNGKMTFVGGNKGGGGNVRSVASSGTDGGDGRFDGVSSFNHHQIVPADEVSNVTSFGNPTTSSPEETTESGLESESRGGEVREDEVKLWNSIVEEASKMQNGGSSEDALDHETMRQFVSPVKAEIESDEYSVFFKTELIYQQALSQEPTNVLLLSNYAQFLYLVVHDHDRAEEYFKRATSLEPADAEVLGHYANFLWMAKKDIEGAEERYLEAIEADPGNMFHAGNYAHFLWNTGGVDTCYPLGSVDEIDEA